MSVPGSTFPIVFNNCISVKGAAFHSGYNMQHLRRLLRDGRLSGMKLGQTWLIDRRTFETYLENAHHTKDKRFSPGRFFQANLRGGLKLSIYLEMEHGNVKVCYLSEQIKFMISEVAKKPRFEPIDERELHSLTSSFMFAVTNSAKSGVSV
jgi:excisionase family DNA binding protein